MTKERYAALMDYDKARLTQIERKVGWHFCVQNDDLLIGPGMMELNWCTCPCAQHLTRPKEEPMDPTAVY